MAAPRDPVALAAARIAPSLYAELRAWLIEHDPDAARLVEWAQRECAPPATPEALAGEVVWIILCAGRTAQSARTIEKRVWIALRAGTPVMHVYGHPARARAIERAWAEREKDFADLQAVLATGSADDLLAWCVGLPQVGATTKYQLAKNFGAEVCKPDIWLCRLAGIADKARVDAGTRHAACMALCAALARASGDRIPTVDTLLWLACNKGVLAVAADAGDIAFHREPSSRRSILEPGPA